MLVTALRSFYIALGSFASAALFALLGAVLVPVGIGSVVRPLQVVSLGAGLLALGALVHGSTVLIRETRIVVRVLQERAAGVQARAGSKGGAAPVR